MNFIEFSDKGFENAVKSVLKTNKKRLTTDDLKDIKGILISEKQTNGIAVPWSSDSSAFRMVIPKLMFSTDASENGKWQDDLVHFSHIECLHVYVPTEDIGFLQGFTELKELYVTNSLNNDWSAIANMLNLRNLYLRNCHFSDLSVIRDICLQQQVRLSQEQKRFPHLENLRLEYCGISDISTLADCKLISELNLSHNQISDLSPLATMSSLYYVTLRYNEITDISPLKVLFGMYSLNLRHNQIIDASELACLVTEGYLSRLYLGHNNIDDFSSLETLHFVDTDFERRRR